MCRRADLKWIRFDETRIVLEVCTGCTRGREATMAMMLAKVNG
jgi:hypothetical protein